MGFLLGENNNMASWKIKARLQLVIFSSLITRALEDNCYVALARIDLSAAFDIVDIELLIKRLRILGLPSDVINLIIYCKKAYFTM